MHIGRREKKILILCMCYFMYVFCYGIVIKLTISDSLLFQIKTFIPELLLLLVMVECMLQGKIHLNRVSFYLAVYSLVVFVFNLINFGLNEQSLYLIRDIYMPLFAFIFLMSANITEEGAEYFLTKMVPFLKVFLIAGLLLAVVEQMRGWEWTSQFYTGYTFYGQDSFSKVKIAHNLGLLRAPSLSGNFATFGYYCLIADIIIRARSSKIWKTILWDAITLACIVLATNKSAIVAFAIVLVLGGTSTIRSKSARLNKVIIAGVVGVALLSAVWLLGDNSDSAGYLTGLINRFDIWNRLSSQVEWTEALFPFRQFAYGTGAEGPVSFWDNTYLYSLFSQGIIGSALWFIVLKDEYKKGKKVKDNTIKLSISYMTILLLVLGLTVNVTQGRGFFSLYLVYIGIACAVQKEQKRN